MLENGKKDISLRLIQALHDLGLDSKSKIKAATGLTDHAIWRYSDGNSVPSLLQLKRIAAALPELDLHWIITGRQSPHAAESSNMPTLQQTGEYIQVKDWYQAWFDEHRLSQDSLAGWIMAENSWAPALMPGDKIIFDRSEKDLDQGGPFLLRINNSTPIMRKVEPAGNNKYLLSSGTPNIIVIEEDELEVIGRVMAVLHKKY